MMKIFNSTFETSIRILILLDQIRIPLSRERIVNYDLMACFAKDFGVTDYNLHGEDHEEAAELPARRIRVNNALKKLVLDGYVLPQKNNVFLFTLSNSGRQYVHSLSSEYASKYASAVNCIHHRFSSKNDSDLLIIICTRDKENTQ
ncbi:MAG: hypothetical protein HUJ53_04645 [Holdemanella sp.]|nr:hypothetical protein [Holdemanella sp.]